MTISRRILVCVCFILVGLTWASSAFAQPRYYPRSSPISPWMNMFQRKPGPLDNYHSFVQPQLQLEETLGQQNTALQQQATKIRSLGQDIRERQRGSDTPPTGIGSVFMDYSHYYPTKGGRAGYHPRATSQVSQPANIGSRYGR
jgi:hypothetical protein